MTEKKDYNLYFLINLNINQDKKCISFVNFCVFVF